MTNRRRDVRSRRSPSFFGRYHKTNPLLVGGRSCVAWPVKGRSRHHHPGKPFFAASCCRDRNNRGSNESRTFQSPRRLAIAVGVVVERSPLTGPVRKGLWRFVVEAIIMEAKRREK